MFLDKLSSDVLGRVLGFLATDEKRLVPICSKTSRAWWVEHAKNEIRRIIEELAPGQLICLECQSWSMITLYYYQVLEFESYIRRVRRLHEELAEPAFQSQNTAEMQARIGKFRKEQSFTEARIRERS